MNPNDVTALRNPVASHVALVYRSIENVVLGVLFSSTPTCGNPVFVRNVSTGKFCRPFAPVSASPGSFGVGPAGSKSMPRAPLEKIWLPRTRLPVPLQCSPRRPC